MDIVLYGVMGQDGPHKELFLDRARYPDGPHKELFLD